MPRVSDIVTVLRAEDYYETFVRNGIEKGLNRTLVRMQLIDTFRKEIFGLVAVRARKSFDGIIPPEGDPEALRIAKNVIRDETKKWIKLCRMFDANPETSGLIRYDDLTIETEDILNGNASAGGVVSTEVAGSDIPEEPSAGVTGTMIADEDIPEDEGELQ